ncbi:hypothetical protein EDD85DRAFT_797032 [Armillaria nabsnona]|nr:hypothetical protein EDD85DRAFT_797032 [Armillaria nabsnona]
MAMRRSRLNPRTLAEWYKGEEDCFSYHVGSLFYSLIPWLAMSSPLCALSSNLEDLDHMIELLAFLDFFSFMPSILTRWSQIRDDCKRMNDAAMGYGFDMITVRLLGGSGLKDGGVSGLGKDLLGLLHHRDEDEDDSIGGYVLLQADEAMSSAREGERLLDVRCNHGYKLHSFSSGRWLFNTFKHPPDKPKVPASPSCQPIHCHRRFAERFSETRRKPELSANRAQSSDLTVNLTINPNLVSLRSNMTQAKYGCLARSDGGVYMRMPTGSGYKEKIWDHAPGAVLVEEAGGVITDSRGGPLDFGLGRTLGENFGVIAASEASHPKVLEAVQKRSRRKRSCGSFDSVIQTIVQCAMGMAKSSFEQYNSTM